MRYPHYRPEGLRLAFPLMRLVLGVAHLLRIVIKDLYPKPSVSYAILGQASKVTIEELTLSMSSKPSGGFFVLVVRILGILSDDGLLG